VPLLVSVFVALAVVALLPEPDGVIGHVAWWSAVLGSAYAAALFVDRVARRALPLAVLLRLSLVFPDRAPSRLQAARRTSLREIERQLQEATDAGEPVEAARTLVSLVGALGLHDKRTRGHSERVRAYVDLLSEEMELPEDDRVRLRWAALLHDIGKLSVPGAVLNGGRDLADEEWAALRRHPAEGERLAGAMLPWLGEWGRCVREHHEHWDGSGYPLGLAGTEISLGARIVAVADAFEVMTANRSYQAAIGATAAREELARCAGKDFDPAVVRAFLQVSLGRLRGVVGPMGFLPVLPFLAAANRAGDAVRGMTTVATVSAVALAATGGAATPAPVPPGPRVPVVALPSASSVPSPPPSPPPAPTPTATPRPTTVALPAAVLTRPRPVVRASPAPAPARPPAPAPARLASVLFLGPDSDLVGELPSSGSVSVPGGKGISFAVALAAPATLRVTPTMVLFHSMRTRHGQGQPRASVRIVLADCLGGTCHTLSTGSAVLARPKAGYAEQSITLSALDTVLAAGHELRVSLALVSRDNVTGLLVGIGGTTSSRLVLG
jgi:hypothetical protein